MRSFVMAIHTSFPWGSCPLPGSTEKQPASAHFRNLHYLHCRSFVGVDLATSAPGAWLMSLSVPAQMAIAMMIQLVVIFILFLLTRFFLKKHLNLE